jgi:hypothetical protein
LRSCKKITSYYILTPYRIGYSMLLLIMIEKCPITKKKRVIMSFLSRSLSGFSCTRAWAVGHTSPESGWPVWRRAPTRPGCCPRNGAGECQILDILNESFPRGLNMKCHEMGSMFGFMIEWLLPYPTKYHEMDFQDIFESTQLSS